MSRTNQMADFAKIFDLELGEHFKVSGCGDTHYFFTTDGLKYKNLGDTYDCNHSLYLSLLTGQYEIIKLPWHPQFSGNYWTYSNEFWDIEEVQWNDTALDFMRLAAGCVFRTQEGALAEKMTKVKELSFTKWE